MKLEEIVLVKEHLKGRTLNYLSTIDDFMLIHVRRITDSLVKSGQIALELSKTLSDDSKWTQIPFSEHKSVEARFCTRESQLRGFLGGRFDEIGEKTIFEEAMCNAYCLDKLSSLGMQMDGSSNPKFQFTYKTVESRFEQGEVLHNFNGRDYKVIEKLSARNLIVMDAASGNFTVAIGAGMYKRYPKGEEPTEDNAMTCLEWDHGVYLGNTPSMIDFSAIRQKYGEVEETETIYDYRHSLVDQFDALKRITKNPLIPDSVKSEAENAMYEKFMTGRDDTFSNNLQEGKYDGGFIGKPVQKEVAR